MWGTKKDKLVTFITVTKCLFRLMICYILQLHQRSLHLHLRILCWEKVCCCSTWYYEANVARSHDAVVCVHVTVGQQYRKNMYNCSWHYIVQLCSKPLCVFLCVCVCAGYLTAPPVPSPVVRPPAGRLEYGSYPVGGNQSTSIYQPSQQQMFAPTPGTFTPDVYR